MLIPIFYGIRNLTLLPATIFIIAIQAFVLLISLPINEKYHKDMNAKVKDPAFYNEMSYKYSKWVAENPRDHSPSVHRVSDKARGGDASYRRIVSQLALRDGKFQRSIASADTAISSPNLVEEKWFNKWLQIRALEKENPIYDWGYKTEEERSYTFFTYQFVHSGVLHFLTNAFFFLLLAPLVELALGSSLFAALYLFGGAFAAYFYSFFQPNTLMPLVGASGSICFLLGFVCVYFWKYKVHYFYWLLPLKGYYGFIKLPTYVALVMWLLNDLGGQLGASTFTSVAHSAHLGGMILGAVFGALYRYLKPVGNIDSFLAGRKTTA